MTMPTIKDIIVRKPTEQETEDCRQWPVWSCENSEFEWMYTQTEKCLIIEGQVEVRNLPANDLSISFGQGDFVELPDGLNCIWKITQPIKKYYDFE